MPPGLRDRGVLVLVVLAATAPFLTRPFHLDDPMYVWAAQAILRDPLDFYGFDVNWYGTLQPMSEVMMNPPLVPYWLAGASALLGAGEVALHLGFLPLALAAALGAYQLASRLCPRPLLASLICVASPVFLVCSTNLGSDVPMLAAWLWAVALWIAGLDRGRPLLLAGAALVAALAVLAKYFAVGLIPLLAAYTVVRERRVSPRLLWLSLPLLAVIGYELTTHRLYGAGLLGGAVSYAGSEGGVGALGPWPLVERWVVGLVFVGGALVTPGLLAPLVWRRRTWWAAAAMVGLGLALAAYGSLGPLRLRADGAVAWLPLVHLVVFAAFGVHVFALGVRDLVRRRDAEAILLFLALLGTLSFALVFNWTVNARSVIALAPLAGILTARALASPPQERSPWLPAGIACGMAVALAVAWADWRLAWTSSEAAAELARVRSVDGGPPRFLGHWGFQHYMEAAGARALDLDGDRLVAGDVLVVPENTPGSNQVPWAHATALRSLERDPSPGIAIQSVGTRASFHAAVRGPLPFYLGPTTPERFVVVRIRRPLRAEGGALRPFRPEPGDEGRE